MTPADQNRGRKAMEGFKAARFADASAARDHLEQIAPDQPGGAVAKYLDGDWRAINTALRAGKTPPGVDEIDQAMQPLPDDLMLRRQVPLSLFAHVPMKDLEGMKVRDAAYASTSLDVPGHEPGGADVVTMHIAAPKGTPALVNAADGEILLARDSEVAITRVEPDGRGGWDVYGAVLPKSKGKSGATAKPAGGSPAGKAAKPPGGQPTQQPEKTAPDSLPGKPEKPAPPASPAPDASPSATPEERSRTVGTDMLGLIQAGVSRSTIGSAMRDLLAEHNLTGDETPELKAFVDLVNSPEAQIRAVVQDLLAERGRKVGIGQYVTLEDVRNRLPSDLDRATVDHALKMLGRADAVLAPESNQKTLTPEQRAAAVHLGGQDKHVIALDGSDKVKLVAAAQSAADSIATPGSAAEPGKKNTPSGKTITGSEVLSASPVGLHRGDSSLTAEQTAGLTEYQDGSKPGFQGINATLRGSRTSDDKTGAAVAGIDSAMASSALTQDVETWRGVRNASTMFGADRMSGDLTGMQWREDAFVSTSPDPGGVGGFAGTRSDPMRMRIVAPAGTAAIDMSDPADPSEVELLLDRGHTFMVVADHGVIDGVRQVDVQVQPKSAGG
jgi:hypothetical protein